MNVLFLTIGDFGDLSGRSVHVDIVKKFVKEGHCVYVACKDETPKGDSVRKQIVDDKLCLLYIKTGALKKKVNLLKKGLSTLLIERRYYKAIRDYYSDISFDLVLYHTPPITFTKVIRFVKQRDNAITYLLLKDIFPQNAVDLGMMTKSGVRGMIYRYFRNKEKELYSLSDFIGCMSPANVDYLLKHNPEINPNRIEVAPNSVELIDDLNKSHDNNEDALKKKQENYYIRSKYHLPANVPIFVYGGNLGKPQGIPFLIDCLTANSSRDDCFIVVIGSGSELQKLKEWYLETNPKTVRVMDGLPKVDYDEFVRTCDVGLIFLDHRFTIPNYPSRLLSYLENKMPVICATDPNTDIGRIAEENGYGYWCESNSVNAFTDILDKMIHSDRKAMGESGFAFLKSHYLVENTYNTIIKHFRLTSSPSNNKCHVS